MRFPSLAIWAALLLAGARPAIAQEPPAAPAAANGGGLSFHLVDEAADPSAHGGETQASFKDQVLWLEAETPITGDMVASARPFLSGPDRRPTVVFQLTPEGAQRLDTLTKANIGRRVAILVGGKVVSAPRIQTEMPDGAGEISGELTRSQASLLALQINHAASAH